MQSALRKIGNSTGLVLPRAILGEIGLTTGAVLDLKVEDGRLIGTPVVRKVREGWAEAAAVIGALPLTEEEQDWLDMPDDIGDDWTW